MRLKRKIYLNVLFLKLNVFRFFLMMNGAVRNHINLEQIVYMRAWLIL